MCTQRPPTIVATTSHLGELLRRQRAGRGRGRRGRRDSRGAACRGAARRRRSQAGATHRRVERLLDGDAPARDATRARSSSVRSTPARMPASGSSSSIGASEPFATTAPDSSSERNAYAPSVVPAQKRSARSRSEGAWQNCTDAATPSSAKRGDVLRREAAAHARSAAAARAAPTRRASASNASSASRFARSPIACTATGQPAARAAADDLRELLAARDLDARAVEHPRRLRAERAVHEHLQVADAQAGRRRARRGAEPSSASSVVVRERLPDAERQRALARSRCQRRSAPSQPSLSCTAVTPRDARA